MVRGHPDWLIPINWCLYPDDWTPFYATWDGTVPAGSSVEVEIGVVPEKSVIFITLCHPSCKDPNTPSKFECFADTNRFRSVYWTGFEIIEPNYYPIFDEGVRVTFRITNYGSADADYTWTGTGFFIVKHRSPPPKIPDCSVTGDPDDYDLIWTGESSLWGKQVCFTKTKPAEKLDNRIKTHIKKMLNEGKVKREDIAAKLRWLI